MPWLCIYLPTVFFSKPPGSFWVAITASVGNQFAKNPNVFKKLSRRKIHNITQGSIILYEKNEEIIDLGETVDIKTYEDVAIGDYFIFVDDQKTVYRKMAKTIIRKLGNELSDTSRYFGNKEVKILGSDISQFV